ncbi:MAG: hypothetical protein EA426_14085 [Spirochaetaceae bacterium]|nr:MAG: hypothetical protein EA426_14085 [Spirochaetaceae bacterium]
MTGIEQSGLRCEPCALATVCVPWDDQGEFLEKPFRRQVRLLRAAGIENLYLFGTAGEGYAVTVPQCRRIASVFMEEVRDLTGLRQLGVIAMSAAQACERIELGLKIGFTDFQVSLPPWGTVNDRERSVFFRDVVGAYPEARFLHYNNARSGRVLTGSEYVPMFKEHPNLVATKSGGHSVASLLSLSRDAPDLCHFFTELDYLTASLLGIRCGLLVSVSAVFPERILEVYATGRDGDVASMRRLIREMSVLQHAILTTVGQTGAHIDGAYDKIYAWLSDSAFPLALQSPYQDAGLEAAQRFKELVAAVLPGWLGPTRDA